VQKATGSNEQRINADFVKRAGESLSMNGDFHRFFHNVQCEDQHAE